MGCTQSSVIEVPKVEDGSERFDSSRAFTKLGAVESAATGGTQEKLPVTVPAVPSRGSYKSAVVKEAGAKLEIIQKEIPTPKAGEVLIKVAACGVCHNDIYGVNGYIPGVKFPLVPGHEVVGTVEEVGVGVEWPARGMLVGVGWHGEHCLFCQRCRKGDFLMCPKSQGCITGVMRDGGWAEYMVAHWTGVAEMPPGIDPVDAAPLMGAGAAVFNGLRRQKKIKDGLKVNDLVAIQGIGGVGHLGIQFAKKMGYKVAAISSSSRKEKLAHDLGADFFINTSEGDACRQLLELGGAKLIICTAPNAKATSDLVNGLAPRGKILLLGTDTTNVEVSPVQIITNRGKVGGWSNGVATDSMDTCRFAHSNSIKSINEVYSLDQAQEAYEHMLNGKANFHVVIKM